RRVSYLRPAASVWQLGLGGRRAWARPAQKYRAAGSSSRKARVALLAGCVNDVLAPDVNAAAIRLLTRHGVEVLVADGAGCCGSLVHHLGREDEALAQARANIDAWAKLGGLDAILVTASGCGT